MSGTKPPKKSQRSLRGHSKAADGYKNRLEALQRPEIRKKISDGVKRARTAETPEQRAAHNKKIAISYRRTVGLNLLAGETSYSERRRIRKWMSAASL
jgi:hypothetical protein